MPGAPNRPPEIAAPPPPPVAPEPGRKVLRRLAPSHVALLLDTWKGALAPDLADPFVKAEGAYAAGDFLGAANALDLLSIRFAEPRWPSLPEPFRRLRVAIPAPVPPHWDPDHARSAAEKEAIRARRFAADQLLLAEASIAWADAHGAGAPEDPGRLAAARAALTETEVGPEFYVHLDPIWEGLRARLPRPKVAARPAAAPAGAEPT